MSRALKSHVIVTLNGVHVGIIVGKSYRNPCVYDVVTEDTAGVKTRWIGLGEEYLSDPESDKIQLVKG